MIEVYLFDTPSGYMRIVVAQACLFYFIIGIIPWLLINALVKPINNPNIRLIIFAFSGIVILIGVFLYINGGLASTWKYLLTSINHLISFAIAWQFYRIRKPINRTELHN
jgi:hypothetical protein